MRLEAYFQDSEYCYFLLELWRSGDIEQLVKQTEKKKFDVETTKFYVMELILALEYMRKHDIVHRDLKPANILVDDSYHLKLADFGVAKNIDPNKVEAELEQWKIDIDDKSATSNDESFDLDDDFGRWLFKQINTLIH